jgi:chromosome segregation ATPase
MPTGQSKVLQRRWSNADGEKVWLWISFGIIITIILFTVLFGTLNICLGKPIAKLRDLEADQAKKGNRVETLTLELEGLRSRFARQTQESDGAKRDKASAERNLNTQREVVQQQNERITGLTQERDEKASELRQRTTELAEARQYGTEKATEANTLKSNLRDVEAERARLERECDRVKMQLSFATEQMARHRRHCSLEEEE